MRVFLVLITTLFAACGGPDPLESHITGRWRTSVTDLTTNEVAMTLRHDENEITGIAYVNDVVYDLEGKWEGTLTPDEVIDLDMTVIVRGMSIKGTGTLATGREDADLEVNGRRSGMSFQMQVAPEEGNAVEVSGRIGYNMNDFRLAVDVENIPPTAADAPPRQLKLTVRGNARGGGLDLF